MPRKPKDLEPEDPEPDEIKTPGASLPAMEDTVRKLSGIFSENMRIPEGPAMIESDDEEDEDDE